MAIVTLDADLFRSYYPQFESSTDSQLEQAFNVACIILDNTNRSIIPYDPDNGVLTRQTLMFLLMCHIMTLFTWSESGQSGPITSAKEGSVSSGFYVPSNSNQYDWYDQTPCGKLFWLAMAPYRVGPVYYNMAKYHPWG